MKMILMITFLATLSSVAGAADPGYTFYTSDDITEFERSISCPQNTEQCALASHAYDAMSVLDDACTKRNQSNQCVGSNTDPAATDTAPLAVWCTTPASKGDDCSCLVTHNMRLIWFFYDNGCDGDGDWIIGEGPNNGCPPLRTCCDPGISQCG